MSVTEFCLGLLIGAVCFGVGYGLGWFLDWLRNAPLERKDRP